ncbi:hypothetical protein ACLQ18_41385 [Streptomyces sp. DT193]|uniref:hypothetical protein n=1 Tax=Streptomyces sp. DT193 TaxID=3393418 RepID=UPI003CFB65B0
MCRLDRQSNVLVREDGENRFRPGWIAPANATPDEVEEADGRVPWRPPTRVCLLRGREDTPAVNCACQASTARGPTSPDVCSWRVAQGKAPSVTPGPLGPPDNVRRTP